MRKVTIAATLILLSSSVLSSSALAQQPPPAATTPSTGAPLAGSAPPVGSPENPGTTVGLAKPADDDLSTRTVKAVPCSVAARETDGTTTCIGIPERGARRSRR